MTVLIDSVPFPVLTCVAGSALDILKAGATGVVAFRTGDSRIIVEEALTAAAPVANEGS